MYTLKIEDVPGIESIKLSDEQWNRLRKRFNPDNFRLSETNYALDTSGNKIGWSPAKCICDTVKGCQSCPFTIITGACLYTCGGMRSAWLNRRKEPDGLDYRMHGVAIIDSGYGLNQARAIYEALGTAIKSE